MLSHALLYDKDGLFNIIANSFFQCDNQLFATYKICTIMLPEKKVCPWIWKYDFMLYICLQIQ